MANYAEIDSDGVVQRVIAVDNDVPDDQGEGWCQALLGGTWKRTSYNARIRKNYAGAGYTYDPARDAFIAPQPAPEAVLNEETCQWEMPEEPTP